MARALTKKQELLTSRNGMAKEKQEPKNPARLKTVKRQARARSSAKPTAKKTGRPTVVTPEKEIALLEAVREGETILTCCKKIKLGYRAVMRRQAADLEFRQRLARAREDGVDAALEKVEEMLMAATPKQISVVREIAHHLRWKAAKLRPKHYGDKVTQEISGPDGGPVPIAAVDAVDYAAAIAKLKAKFGGKPAATS